MARLKNYPDITIDSERGPINIRDYILNMDRLGTFGGELEIGIAANIYDIIQPHMKKYMMNITI